MAIQDIVNGVTARLTGTQVLLGKKYLDQNSAPPRVVFVPSRDKYGPPQRIGGAQKAIHTCWAGLQVHVWAADVAATESLKDQVLQVLRDTVAGLTVAQIAADGYRVLGGGWLDNAWTNRGEVYVLEIECGFPVAPALGPTKVVTSIPQTNQLETPGNPPTEEDAG